MYFNNVIVWGMGLLVNLFFHFIFYMWAGWTTAACLGYDGVSIVEASSI